MGWKEIARYPVALVGILSMVYWWQGARINFHHLIARPFESGYFALGIILLALGVYLFVAVSRENV